MKTNNPQVGQQHIITHILLVIAIIFIFTTYVFGQAERRNNSFNSGNTGITPQKKAITLQPFSLENSIMRNFTSPVKKGTSVKLANDFKKLSKR